MTAYSSSHQRQIDSQSEPDTDDRVAALTQKIVSERMDSPRHVAEAIDELAGTSDVNSDGNTHFAADMAAVLDATDAAFNAEAIRYFHRLRDKAREYLRREAESDAEFRIAQQDADADEARTEMRNAA